MTIDRPRARRLRAVGAVGQAMVEAAIVLPIALLAVFGGLTLVVTSYDRARVQSEVESVAYTLPIGWDSGTDAAALDSVVRDQIVSGGGLDPARLSVSNASVSPTAVDENTGSVRVWDTTHSYGDVATQHNVLETCTLEFDCTYDYPSFWAGLGGGSVTRHVTTTAYLSRASFLTDLGGAS